MKVGKRLAALGLAALGGLTLTGQAQAAFPDYSDCPTGNPDVAVCVNVQSRDGSLRIKDFTVPIGESFQIRGGLTTFVTGNRFVAPRGTTGIFAKPIQVPGGLIGIDFPIPGNSVTATAQLAGVPADVRFNLATLSVSLPVKLSLSNVLLGMNCKIGTNSSPVILNLTTGTTNPPAPNRPISGRYGTFTPDGQGGVVTGNVNVDNSLSIPGASDCGIGLGLINALVNLKLKLPSTSGNNEMIVQNDVGLRFL
jgi:hypothetical protein